MDSHLLSRLVEISAMPDSEQAAVIACAPADDVRQYLEILQGLDSIAIPEPSITKKWDGRTALLEAVEGQASSRPSGIRLPIWARAVPAAAAAGAILTVSVAAASMATDGRLANRPVSHVLAAFGIEPGASGPSDLASPVSPPEPRSQPDALPGLSQESFEPPDGPFGQPVATPSNLDEQRAEGVDPPGQGGENPGQGVDPPGQGEENPGQGVDPPGQGGEPPGQGVDPPGQSGEPPGQGVDPPGQGGEPPGQGVDPPGQGGEPPGQGVDPPGQGGEPPGQGVDPPGQGGETPGQGVDPPGQGGENPGQGNRP